MKLTNSLILTFSLVITSLSQANEGASDTEATGQEPQVVKAQNATSCAVHYLQEVAKLYDWNTNSLATEEQFSATERSFGASLAQNANWLGQVGYDLVMGSNLSKELRGILRSSDLETLTKSAIDFQKLGAPTPAEVSATPGDNTTLENGKIDQTRKATLTYLQCVIDDRTEQNPNPVDAAKLEILSEVLVQLDGTSLSLNKNDESLYTGSGLSFDLNGQLTSFPVLESELKTVLKDKLQFVGDEDPVGQLSLSQSILSYLSVPEWYFPSFVLARGKKSNLPIFGSQLPRLMNLAAFSNDIAPTLGNDGSSKLEKLCTLPLDATNPSSRAANIINLLQSAYEERFGDQDQDSSQNKSLPYDRINTVAFVPFLQFMLYQTATLCSHFSDQVVIQDNVKRLTEAKLQALALANDSNPIAVSFFQDWLDADVEGEKKESFKSFFNEIFVQLSKWSDIRRIEPPQKTRSTSLPTGTAFAAFKEFLGNHRARILPTADPAEGASANGSLAAGQIDPPAAPDASAAGAPTASDSVSAGSPDSGAGVTTEDPSSAAPAAPQTGVTSNPPPVAPTTGGASTAGNGSVVAATQTTDSTALQPPAAESSPSLGANVDAVGSDQAAGTGSNTAKIEPPAAAEDPGVDTAAGTAAPLVEETVEVSPNQGDEIAESVDEVANQTVTDFLQKLNSCRVEVNSTPQQRQGRASSVTVSQRCSGEFLSALREILASPEDSAALMGELKKESQNGNNSSALSELRAHLDFLSLITASGSDDSPNIENHFQCQSLDSLATQTRLKMDLINTLSLNRFKMSALEACSFLTGNLDARRHTHESDFDRLAEWDASRADGRKNDFQNQCNQIFPSEAETHQGPLAASRSGATSDQQNSALTLILTSRAAARICPTLNSMESQLLTVERLFQNRASAAVELGIEPKSP